MDEFLLSPMIAWPDYQEESEQFYNWCDDCYDWGTSVDEVRIEVNRFPYDDNPASTRVDVGTQTDKVRRTVKPRLTAHELKCSMMMRKDLK
jgi:hypothetical protein